MVIGAAMGGPLILALAAGDGAAGDYFFAASITLIVGFGALAVTNGVRSRPSFRCALLCVLLWWALAPAFAAAPLAFGGMTWSAAYFDAVSALTTTGAWIDPDSVYADRVGMLWRAELQWIGGLASLAIAAAIFIRPAFIGIDTMLPPFARGDRGSYVRPIRDAVVVFAAPYCILTAGAFAFLAATGVDIFDAAILSLSTAASGGMTPKAEGLDAYGALTIAALFPFVVLSGVNFVLLARVMRGKLGRVRDFESGAFVGMIVVIGAAYWLFMGATGVGDLAAQIFNAASLLSTNGVLIGEAPDLSIALVTAIIGGAAVSTAGGFKVLRWLVIMRRAGEEIRKLITPSGVFGTTRIANEFGVWMHFLVFTMMLASLVLAVSAGGHGFEMAIATATAALSNTGPLLNLVQNGDGGYGVFDGPLRLVLMAGMILGRLEAVAALALFNRAFWRS